MVFLVDTPNRQLIDLKQGEGEAESFVTSRLTTVLGALPSYLHGDARTRMEPGLRQAW